jgi:hypothetical protein
MLLASGDCMLVVHIGSANGGSIFTETSVNFHQTTRRHIPEDSLHSHRLEKLKSKRPKHLNRTREKLWINIPNFLKGYFCDFLSNFGAGLLICFMSNIAWQKLFRPGLTIQLINMEGQNSCAEKAANLEVLVVVLNVCGGWRSQHLRGWAFNTRTPLSVERGGSILSVMNYCPPDHVTVKVWIFQNNT